MRLFRFFLFLLAFSIEVRVHAGEQKPQESQSYKIWQQPENCLSGESVCAIRLARGKYTLALGHGGHVVMSQGSTLVRVNDDSLKKRAKSPEY